MEIQSRTSEQSLDTYRHSTSHIMAAAVQVLYPHAKIAIGPSIEDGFYYDFDLPETLNEESLKKLLLTANIRGIKCSAFTEPDLENAMTALTLEPGDATCKLCSSLPLAFKEYTETFNKIYGKEVANGN